MQYTEIFSAVKIENFVDFFYIIYIDCGYMLELPRTHNLCFGAKIRKKVIPLYTPVLLYKSEDSRGTLHGHVL